MHKDCFHRDAAETVYSPLSDHRREGFERFFARVAEWIFRFEPTATCMTNAFPLGLHYENRFPKKRAAGCKSADQ